MIKANNLDKYFYRHKSNEIHVINGFDYVLPENGITAIFGKSGCGKTTLLNVLGGLDKPDSGCVEIDGESMKNGNDYIRNRYIGYIFQNYNLNRDKTVYENVADILRLCGIKDTETIDERVNYALESVGMKNFAKRYPDNLSGGQQQRVAIARAIVKSPKIILADEPTGNLDETNTVMVMDMLKAISKNCLVLLVTHEEKLVDHYCDRVIELSDGKIVGQRINTDANGYSMRSKNDIYLGELEKSDDVTDGCEIEYFGNKTEEKIKLRIVNSNGNIYLRVETPGIKVIDQSSEIKLKDGVFVDKTAEGTVSKEYKPLLSLPEKKSREYGKLFTFFASFKKGFMTVGTDKRKGKKFLRGLMGMFSAVIVIFSAVYGKKIDNMSETTSKVNDKIFLANIVNTENITEVLEKAEKDEDSGIDYFSYTQYSTYGYAGGYVDISFSADYFITSTQSTLDEIFADSDSALSSSAVCFPYSILENFDIVAGKADKDEKGIWISKGVADKIIENSPYEYLKEYSDIIGLAVNGQSGKTVTAIIDTDELSYYVPDDEYYSDLLSNRNIGAEITKDETLKDGEIIVIDAVDSFYEASIKEGDKVFICGKEYTVKKLSYAADNYVEWLEKSYPDDYALIEFNLINEDTNYINTEFYEKLCTDGDFASHFNLSETEKAYLTDADTAATYLPFLPYVYAYEHFDEWCEIATRTGWGIYDDEIYNMYATGVLPDAKYYVFGHSYSTNPTPLAIYYYYVSYTEKNGVTPDYTELENVMGDGEYTLSDLVNKIYSLYDSEQHIIIFYTDYTNVLSSTVSALDDSLVSWYSSDISYSYYSIIETTASDYDYIKKAYGKTSEAVDNGMWNCFDNDDYSDKESLYVIHCTDTAKAQKYLESIYGELGTGDIEYGGTDIITANQLKEYSLKLNDITAAGIIIPFVIVMGLLALCVYFILRSTLMNRVKEIGIYRAIGVTKNNIRFEFMSETLSLATTAVVPSFAIFSAIMFYAVNSSSIIEQYLFYPPWFALAMLLFTLLVCVVCGLIPVNRLIRKTPAELIAKYDI